MLYLDSSVLVKRYFAEAGSDALRERLLRGDMVYTSALSYAEVLAVMGRKFRQGVISDHEFESLYNRMSRDWRLLWNILELDTRTMDGVRDLVKQFGVKGADAVHLSAALWLGNQTSLAPEFVEDEPGLEFGVSDKTLARIASQCGLEIFDPEKG